MNDLESIIDYCRCRQTACFGSVVADPTGITTAEEFLVFYRQNWFEFIHWGRGQVVSLDWLRHQFSDSQLMAAGIYLTGNHTVSGEVIAGGCARLLHKGGGRVVAVGHSVVRVYGNAKVDAYGHCVVHIDGDAEVTAYGHVSVHAHSGRVDVYLGGRSRLLADTHVSVIADRHSTGICRCSGDIELLGNASFTLKGDMQATLRGDSSAVLRDRATAVLYDRSRVRAHAMTHVTAYGDSYVRAHGSSRVELHEHAVADLFNVSCGVSSDMSLVLCHSPETDPPSGDGLVLLTGLVQLEGTSPSLVAEAFSSHRECELFLGRLCRLFRQRYTPDRDEFLPSGLYMSAADRFISLEIFDRAVSDGSRLRLDRPLVQP